MARLSPRLGIVFRELGGYAVQGQTCTDHLREIAEYVQWRAGVEPHTPLGPRPSLIGDFVTKTRLKLFASLIS